MDEHQRASWFGHVFQDPMMGTAGDMSVLENLEIAYLRGRNRRGNTIAGIGLGSIVFNR